MKELKTLSGIIIPQIGLGTYPLQGEELATTVQHALEIGYRLIDTSDDYRGEVGIGIGCKKSFANGCLKREDIFLQTKISANNSFPDEPLAGLFFNPDSPFMKRHSVAEIVRDKVEESLFNMKTDYIDSLLIHLPYPYYYEEIWDTMLIMQKEGKIRYIGVSNFHPHHIENCIKRGGKPSINEIYLSPICIKNEQIVYAYENNIQVMTYSPLIDVAHGKINELYFIKYIQKYQKSLAQIILRWNIDRGCLPLPKTKNINRLKENFDVFDFSLTKDEINEISMLNIDSQYLPESKICPGL